MSQDNKTIRKFGWIPDVPDARDHYYKASGSPDKKPLPDKVDLRNKCPPVYDQGELGSCTSNATAGAVEFDLMKQKLKVFTPSRLFIYYNERVIEGTVDSDGGAELRTAIKEINKNGACDEKIWPYNIKKYKEKPSKEAYDQAKNTIGLKYRRIPRDLNQFKSCLAEGYPFLLGMSIYSKFDSQEMEDTGVLNMPDLQKEKLLDGHTALVVGYDDSSKRFIVRNSWGPNWGQDGYFTIPYDYLLNESLTDDFWVLNTVK